jgi:hypothetical protein
MELRDKAHIGYAGGVKLQMRQFDAARAAVFKGIASSPNL